jgi:beta-lactamase regulating signal transducer with metallopeptidase domain
MNELLAAFLKALVNSSFNFCFCLIFTIILARLLPLRSPHFRYVLFFIPLVKLWYDFSSQLVSSSLMPSVHLPGSGGALDLCFFMGLGSSGLSLWSLIFSCIMGTHAISMGDLALMMIGSQWSSLLIFGWASVALFLIARRNAHYVSYIRNLICHSYEDEGLTAAMKGLIGNASSVLRLLKPRIMLSPIIKTPMVIGVLNPRILIPTGLLGTIEEPALYTIVTHELCHIRRGDNLVNYLFSLTKDLFFFLLPLSYLITLLNLERERICDRMTVGEEKERVFHFARALLCVAEMSLKVTGTTSDHAFAASSLYRPGKKELLSRVSEIVSLPEENRGIFDNGYMYAIISILIFKLLIGVSFFASSEIVSTTACAAMRIVVIA